MTVIEGINIFLNIINNCKCVRVFELLTYLSAKVYTVVLFRVLRACNLLLLKVPSCLIAAAVYRISVEFSFRLSRNFLREEGWI